MVLYKFLREPRRQQRIPQSFSSLKNLPCYV